MEHASNAGHVIQSLFIFTKPITKSRAIKLRLTDVSNVTECV